MSTRKYTSELRDAQAEGTRTRILDALVEVLADGVDTLSIPTVAERAGVSVGTIYRHFGDKAGLLNALPAHAGKRTGFVIDSIPESLDELDDVVHQVFQLFEATDDLLRAAFATQAGREARVQGSAGRLQLITDVLHRIDPALEPDQLEHLAKLSLILTTSEAYQQWKDRLGMSPREAANEVMWAIKTVIRGVRS